MLIYHLSSKVFCIAQYNHIQSLNGFVQGSQQVTKPNIVKSGSDL